ncbi:hypothetical protein LCGC14_2552930 [marine sediment metagenome]|uniref:Uncharacterized protein n=1 Tax=marine sediment metagenome TaxID=412755 RepID=A0A0F9AMB4_9ZZZZ
MAKEEDILTELVGDAIDRVYEQLEDPEPSARISGYTVTAIANAAKQIKAQQRKRVNILRFALDRIWTSSMTADLAQQIAGTALAEWKTKLEATDV